MNTHKVGLCTVLFSFSGYHDFNYMTEYRTQYLSLLRIRPGPGLPMLPGFMIVFRLDNSSLQAEVTIVMEMFGPTSTRFLACLILWIYTKMKTNRCQCWMSDVVFNTKLLLSSQIPSRYLEAG